MSVINQMLRDLEQRKVKDTNTDHYIDAVNIIAPEKFNRWWLLFPLFLLTLLLIVIVAVSFYSQDSVKTKEEPLLTLPVNVSEINNVADITQAIKKQENTPVAVEKPLSVVDNQPIKKTYKQPSVKTQITIKHIPIVSDNNNNNNVKKEPANKNINVKIKQSPDVKTASIKVKDQNKKKQQNKVKTASVQAEIINKTMQQIVFQARKLMVRDQNSAIQLLKDNLKLLSPDADYYSLLANLQQRQKTYDEAIISYRKALEITPYKGELWIGIALAYRGTGEEENSIKAFKRALSSDDISPELRAYATQQIAINY